MWRGIRVVVRVRVYAVAGACLIGVGIMCLRILVIGCVRVLFVVDWVSLCVVVVLVVVVACGVVARVLFVRAVGCLFGVDLMYVRGCMCVRVRRHGSFRSGAKDWQCARGGLRSRGKVGMKEGQMERSPKLKTSTHHGVWFLRLPGRGFLGLGLVGSVPVVVMCSCFWF